LEITFRIKNRRVRECKVGNIAVVPSRKLTKFQSKICNGPNFFKKKNFAVVPKFESSSRAHAYLKRVTKKHVERRNYFISCIPKPVLKK
jgi:hypothetical protein